MEFDASLLVRAAPPRIVRRAAFKIWPVVTALSAVAFVFYALAVRHG